MNDGGKSDRLIVPGKLANKDCGRPQQKLAALAPPPRLHLIRYHGVLAPHAADRALTDPHSIRTYLTGVGLPADPPTISPARPPPQQQLDFAA